MLRIRVLLLLAAFCASAFFVASCGYGEQAVTVVPDAVVRAAEPPTTRRNGIARAILRPTALTTGTTAPGPLGDPRPLLPADNAAHDFDDATAGHYTPSGAITFPVGYAGAGFTGRVARMRYDRVGAPGPT